MGRQQGENKIMGKDITFWDLVCGWSYALPAFLATDKEGSLDDALAHHKYRRCVSSILERPPQLREDRKGQLLQVDHWPRKGADECHCPQPSCEKQGRAVGLLEAAQARELQEARAQTQWKWRVKGECRLS